MNDLRKDDPVYYKITISQLLKQAKENGLEMYIGENPGKSIILYFKANNGDCAGVKLMEKI